MSRQELFDAIGAGFARLVEFAPHFDEATIPVDQDEASDWTTVGDDLRDAMKQEAEEHPDAGGLKT